MNDRLRFRCWVKPENKMCDVSSFCEAITKVYNDKGKLNAFRTLLTADCILEQCTGLKDKNGKLIYEGDVVRYGLHNCLVEWYRGGFWINGFTNGASWQIHDLAGSLEVLGNVHENKELLK